MLKAEPLSTHDWLENFRMSQATICYVRNEIWLAIEKENTMMKNATLWSREPHGRFGSLLQIQITVQQGICLVHLNLLCPLLPRSVCCHHQNFTLVRDKLKERRLNDLGLDKTPGPSEISGQAAE